MIRLKRMGVAGTTLFKASTFEFHDGISYVYGLNKSTALKTNNSNATGKSRFFGYLSELLYDVPVVGLKQDRHKAGKRFVEFEYAGHQVKIMSSFATNGREKVTIWMDGQQRSYLTAAKGKAAIAKLFRPTVEDFNAYVYIDSRVPHPLVRGTSTERKSFFTAFFGLDRIDAERKVFNAELSALLRVKAAHAELKRSYTEIRADVLTSAQVQKLQDQYRVTKAKVAALGEKQAHAQNVRRLTEFCASFKPQLTKLEAYLGGTEFSEEVFTEIRKDALWALKDARKGLAEAREWEAYCRDLEVYKKAVSACTGEPDPDLYAEGALKYERARTVQASVEDQLAALGRCKAPEEVEEPSGDLEALLGKQSNLKATLSHSHKFGSSGKCYACGQAVEVVDQDQVEESLRKIQSRIARHRAYAEYQREAEAYTAYLDQRRTLVAKLKKADRMVDKYHEDYDNYQVVRNIKRPPAFAGRRLQSSVMERVLSDAQEKLSVLDLLKPNLETILEARALSDQARAAAAKFDDSQLYELQSRMAQIRAKLEVHQAVRTRAIEMRGRLKHLEEQLEAEEPLRLLIKGYADKSMKKMAIEAICSRLMKLVNHYSQPYFPGFNFEFVWNTQLSIIAHRPNGEPSDVRKLSGAESLLFTLVLLMSLSDFVPSRKRVSTLILDEPSSSFSEESTRVFHEMLPQLNKIFPSIVVITPKTEEQYPGAHLYTIVRTKEGAHIEEGLLVS